MNLETYYESPVDPAEVLVCTPTAGNVHPAHHEAMIALKHHFPRLHFIVEQNGRCVASCRNTLVRRWAESGKEWMLMIDDDIAPPMNVLNLMRWAEPASDEWQPNLSPTLPEGRKIIAAVCPTLVPGALAVPNVYTYVKEQNDYVSQYYPRGSGLHEPDAVGSGCIAIHRSVLDVNGMIPLFRHLDNEWGEMVEGVDIYLCRKAKDRMIRVWANLDVWCEHLTTVPLLHQYDITDRTIGEHVSRALQTGRDPIGMASTGEKVKRDQEPEATEAPVPDVPQSVSLTVGDYSVPEETADEVDPEV